MRIEPANSIRVSLRTGMSDQLRDLQKGAELPARIVDRISGREAVLEIGGKRIQAEFQKGVPAGTMITLKLDNIKNNSFYFKLVDPAGREALARHVMEMTIFDMNRVQKNISAVLSKNPAGIFELNALLSGLHPGHDKKDEGLTRFLGLLMKLGVDKNTITDLSIFLSGIPVNSKAFQSLLLVLGFDREKIKKWTSGKTADYQTMIDGISNEITRLEGDDTKETVLRQLIGLLSDAGSTPSGYISGEIPFAGDDELYRVRYLGKDDAWVFSVNFSKIGLIEVVARENREGRHISIFCGSGETLDALQGSAGELTKNLKNINPDIYLNFYNTSLALNKIVEIYSYFSLNSVFDIRV